MKTVFPLEYTSFKTLFNVPENNKIRRLGCIINFDHIPLDDIY